MAETASSGLWEADALDDPYTIYRRLLHDKPLRGEDGVWIITRYADVQPLLYDPRMLASRIDPPQEWLDETGYGPLFVAHQRMMLFSDAPDHTRLRSLVNKAFTPRVVEAMRERIQSIVDELLDRVADTGSMDIIRDLAYPLPVTVIAEMLGIPLEQRERFKRWSDHVAAFIGGTPADYDQTLRDALQTVLEMHDYFLEIAADLRINPRNNLVSALAQAEQQGDRLTGDELVANCILLLVAGHETTTNLIGNGILALLRHPEQLQRLRDHPELIATAVEEILRFDGPVQGTSRRAGADIVVAGQTIHAGEDVALMIGAANRDGDRFDDPERFDIARSPNRHLAFGHGAHFCLGAPLARMEGQLALGTLVRRLPDLHLATSELHWRDNYTLRGLTELPVHF